MSPLFHLKTHRRSAFTLVELLTVIGIISVLIAMLMPALIGARRAAQATQCASNLRQLTTALMNYAADFKGNFPVNVGSIKQYWTTKSAIGRYIRPTLQTTDETVGGSVMICPSDLPGAVRCYSMNTFASSMVSDFVMQEINNTPPRGKLFKLGVGESSNMILLIESFSVEDWPADDPNPTGFASPALVGFVPARPAERFGAGGVGMFVQGGYSDRFGDCAAQVCYFRHRTSKMRGGLGDTIGRLNIGFVDGHVSLHSYQELVDSNGKCTFLAMWSPVDREID